MRTKRNQRSERPDLNAGSMADIAFLLLIFFLVTTTMDTEVGILRLLPPMEKAPQPTEANGRDVYEVNINDANELSVEGIPMDIQDLRSGVKEFMTNPENSLVLPERRSVNRAICEQGIALARSRMLHASDEVSKQVHQKELSTWEHKLAVTELIGDFQELPPNAVIALRTGSRTSYAMYMNVQNELEAAVAELREALCMEKFHREFKELNEKSSDDRPLIKAIRAVHPQRISEAEPLEVQSIR